MPVLPEPRFQIVLLHPEIPNNTGAIGRTAAATGCRLHVVHPIAFDMGESARRRAGLDYWHLVDCVEHESWEAFLESEGLESVRRWAGTERSVTLPMIDVPAARSLNLANAVCAAVYEGLRQLAPA
jgi:tRNA (cytidine/uridine-2'-O-)-methyltransferase